MKSVVLLSAGLDSTVNLYAARELGTVVRAITFDYGQRAAPAEIHAAAALAARVDCEHEVVALPFLKRWGGSSLTDDSRAVPVGAEVSIDSLSQSQKTAKSVWVPNRNGVFLNIGAGYAEALGADAVVPGFNAEEAATFPDNSQAFLEQATRSLSYSTANQVRVVCTTTALNKSQIVQRGIELGVDFSMIWPCYFAGNEWCGLCESCQRSRRALQAGGLSWDDLRARSGGR